MRGMMPLGALDLPDEAPRMSFIGPEVPMV